MSSIRHHCCFSDLLCTGGCCRTCTCMSTPGFLTTPDKRYPSDFCTLEHKSIPGCTITGPAPPHSTRVKYRTTTRTLIANATRPSHPFKSGQSRRNKSLQWCCRRLIPHDVYYDTRNKKSCLSFKSHGGWNQPSREAVCDGSRASPCHHASSLPRNTELGLHVNYRSKLWKIIGASQKSNSKAPWKKRNK